MGTYWGLFRICPKHAPTAACAIYSSPEPGFQIRRERGGGGEGGGMEDNSLIIFLISQRKHML